MMPELSFAKSLRTFALTVDGGDGVGLGVADLVLVGLSTSARRSWATVGHVGIEEAAVAVEGGFGTGQDLGQLVFPGRCLRTS